MGSGEASGYRAEVWREPAGQRPRPSLRTLQRGHLERTLKVYIAHYNAHRPHRALQLEPPDPAATVTLISGHPPARVHRRDLLGGLLHEYRRAA